MRGRDYKQFAAGEYYHVYNRGNNKADIFLDAEDYTLFFRRCYEAVYPERKPLVGNAGDFPRKPLPSDSFSILTHSFMPNHFHFLMRQETDLPISAFMQKVATSYSKYCNKKYARVGSLFQDQFKAIHITSNEQLLHVSAYIHNNAPLAGLSDRLGEYPYDSFPEYEGKVQNALCKPEIILGQFDGIDSYRRFVLEARNVTEINKACCKELED